MYPVQGVPPPAPLQRADEAAFGLRLNQRLVAEVLHIATDHVVLGLEGVPVVARLTSAEQAAMLAERRTAQFVVRAFSEHGLTLQLVGAAASGPPNPAGPPELAPALLQQAGLPADPARQLIAQALLEHGLPVTADLVNELAEALAGLKTWGAADAQNAAGLKAAGLPLNAAALHLLAAPQTDPATSLRSLQTELRALDPGSWPARLADLFQKALVITQHLSLDWGPSGPDLADQLRRLVGALGRSVEHGLAQPNHPPTPEASGCLTTLAQLRAELDHAGLDRADIAGLRQSLDQFLAAVRLDHFKNLHPDGPPAEGRWLSLGLPLGNPPEHTAQLRVAYRPDGGAETIDARHTRLTLIVPVADGNRVQVDLSVVDRQIGALITATDKVWQAAAEAELPEFREGLARLGFTLKAARCDVGRHPGESAPAGHGRPTPAHRVNVEA